MDEQKPSMGRVVIYNHPGSADGKYPPIKSPAIIMQVHDIPTTSETPAYTTVDLFVVSNTGGIFFAKGISKQNLDEGSSWSWPARV